jgi:hypothetical protein
MRTGTVAGYFTNPPRSSTNDLSCYDGEIFEHYTVGSQDLQLGITGQPSAITLSDVSANGAPNSTMAAVAGVVLATMLTFSLMAASRRQAAKEQNRNR